MLVTLKEIAEIAEENKVAIGSFNTPNLAAIEAVIEAAEEEEQPVILMFAECHEEWVPLHLIGPAMLNAAKKAKVPVCVHLDHGEHTEYIRRALEIGFTGVMFDGSVLSYEENVANTKKVVEMAKMCGASVEAELGCMGRRESGANEGSGNQDETKIYTNPGLAAEFVAETGIDLLACSFGTTHGIYLSKPKLDFQIIRDVRAQTKGIPVVMHGGSGVSREDYHEVVKAGVRKINYFTYMDKAGGQGVKDYLDHAPADTPLFYSQVYLAARDAMKENVRHAIRMFALKE
jgi:ketose-bisphosphate aldolase, class II